MTINVASHIIVTKTSAIDPQTISTAGLSWSAGQVVYSSLGMGGAITSADPTATDDTSIFRAKQETAAPLYLHEWTIGGGAVDGTFSYNLSATRRAISEVLSIAETSGPDANASNFATATGTGDGAGGVKPQGAGFTADAAGCLVIAIMCSRGGFTVNPPAAPTGYTLLDQSATANATGTASETTHAAAVRDTLTSASESVPAATFTGLGTTYSQVWSTVHFAMAPVAAAATSFLPPVLPASMISMLMR